MDVGPPALAAILRIERDQGIDPVRTGELPVAQRHHSWLALRHLTPLTVAPTAVAGGFGVGPLFRRELGVSASLPASLTHHGEPFRDPLEQPSRRDDRCRRRPGGRGWGRLRAAPRTRRM